MKYCDTFCGMGGFSAAMHLVFGNKANCVWAVDYDKKVADTFRANYGIECHGNIREAVTSDIPDHDVIFGGFPCQPFSRNGKWFTKNGKVVGASEERDNLFLELVRILTDKKPKYFVFENVKGLLSMRNIDGSLYYDTIIENLKAVGYKVYSEVLDAADYGVAQQRDRVFFVGIREDINQEFSFPDKLPRTTSIEDILQNNVDSHYLLKNLWKNRSIKLNYRPENAKFINHPFDRGTSRFEVIQYLYDKAIKPLNKTGSIESVAILYGDTPSGLPRQQDKIYSINGISPTIATFSTPSIDSSEGLRQLTPRECARLQGFPDTYLLHSKDAFAYKQIGNAVAVPVVKAIIERLLINGKN